MYIKKNFKIFHFLAKFLNLLEGPPIEFFLNRFFSTTMHSQTKFHIVSGWVLTFGLDPLPRELCICSGYDPLRHLKTDCEVLEGDLSKITHTFEMWGGDHRLNSGHVRLNESTMLVTGGYDQSLYTQVSWTEFITANGMIPGNYLPITIAKHCMVQEMEGVVYLIGGNQDQGIWESPKTWIVELDAASNDFQVYEGPTLNEGREGHSCGTIKDKYGNVIIVVAGGQGKKSVEYLNTTNYIYPNWNWTMGKQPKE